MHKSLNAIRKFDIAEINLPMPTDSLKPNVRTANKLLSKQINNALIFGSFPSNPRGISSSLVL